MIYFKDGSQAETLVDLINAGFSRNRYFTETYSDLECTEVQTYAGKRRSFSDLLEIARTYFPDTTEKELMQALVEARLFGCWCHNINKVTFMKADGSFLMSAYRSDEVGVDGYSMDILNKILES